MDRLRLTARQATSEPLVQALAVALLALLVSLAGEAAGWFAMAMLAGVSLSGSP